jgi:hypothetical protein
VNFQDMCDLSFQGLRMFSIRVSTIYSVHALLLYTTFTATRYRYRKDLSLKTQSIHERGLRIVFPRLFFTTISQDQTRFGTACLRRSAQTHAKNTTASRKSAHVSSLSQDRPSSLSTYLSRLNVITLIYPPHTYQGQVMSSLRFILSRSRSSTTAASLVLLARTLVSAFGMAAPMTTTAVARERMNWMISILSVLCCV